jgi:DNA-binding IclR family transcriptional regulator
MSSKDGFHPVKSVARVAQILDCLASGPSGRGLAEVARAVGLHIATTRRLLMTLTELELVKQSGENRKYSLGLKILLMAKRAGANLDLRQISLPFLHELMEKTGETANLVIEDKGEAVYIEQVESVSYLRTANKLGSRAPLYCTAAGKVLLASRRPQERRELLKSLSLRRFTSRTIVRKEQLLRELERISNQDLAIDNEEQMVGERCIAVPVRDHTGRVIGAVSISGPSFRLTPARIRELKTVVLEVGKRISKELGCDEALSLDGQKRRGEE